MKSLVLFVSASFSLGTMAVAHSEPSFSDSIIRMIKNGESTKLEKLASAGIVTGNPYDSNPETTTASDLITSLKGCVLVVNKETHYLKDNNPKAILGTTSNMVWRCSKPPNILSSKPLPLSKVYLGNKEYCFDDVVTMDIYLRQSGHIIFARKSKMMNPERCESGGPYPATPKPGGVSG